MPERDLQIRVGAETGVAQAALSALSGQVSGLNTVISALKSPTALLTAGFAALSGAIVHSVSTFNEVVKSARDFSTLAGVSIGQAAGLQGAMDDLGVSSSSLRTAIFRMSQEIDSGGKTLARFGIETTDAEGRVKSAGDLFMEVQGVLSRLGSETERNAALQKIFGRGAVELLPIFELQADAFEELVRQNRDLMNVTEEDRRTQFQFQMAISDLKDALTAVSLVIAREVIPTVTQWARWLGSLLTTQNLFTDALKGFKIILDAILTVIRNWFLAMATLVDMLWSLVTFDFSGALANMRAYFEKVFAMYAELAERAKTTAGAMTKAAVDHATATAAAGRAASEADLKSAVERAETAVKTGKTISDVAAKTREAQQRQVEAFMLFESSKLASRRAFLEAEQRRRMDDLTDQQAREIAVVDATMRAGEISAREAADRRRTIERTYAAQREAIAAEMTSEIIDLERRITEAAQREAAERLEITMGARDAALALEEARIATIPGQELRILEIRRARIESERAMMLSALAEEEALALERNARSAASEEVREAERNEIITRFALRRQAILDAAEAQIVENADAQHRLRLEREGTFWASLTDMAVRAYATMESAGYAAAQSVMDGIDTMAAGIGDAFARMLVAGESFGRALVATFRRVFIDIIGDLIKQMIVRFILSLFVKKGKEAAGKIAEVTMHEAAGVAVATAQAPATFGASLAWIPIITAAATAAKAIITAMGALPLALGGIVTAPTLALVGERGPEAVIPLDRGLPRAVSPTVQIMITGNTFGREMGPEEMAEAVGEELMRVLRTYSRS